MRQGLYCVFDEKVTLYSSPFFAVSDEGAIRSFKDALQQEGTLLGKHPEDFSLIRLADVEDSEGTVTVPSASVCVFHGRNLFKKEK